MKLGIGLGYSPSKLKIPMDDILFAEKMGFDSVWAAESYGSDAVSVASYVLAQTSKIKVGTAIMQMQARTPAMTAIPQSEPTEDKKYSALRIFNVNILDDNP